jgi:hypothetical protein
MSQAALVPLTDKVYTRAPYWHDMPDEKWMDWRWQMSNRLNTVDELSKVINLTRIRTQSIEHRWPVPRGHHPLLCQPHRPRRPPLPHAQAGDSHRQPKWCPSNR